MKNKFKTAIVGTCESLPHEEVFTTLKETQKKWEYKLSQIMYKDYNDEELSDDLVEKVKQIETEAHQRGKEETLEEVERVIDEQYILKVGQRGGECSFPVDFDYIDRDILLQTINKMK